MSRHSGQRPELARQSDRRAALTRLAVAVAIVPILPAVVLPASSPGCFPPGRPPRGEEVRSTAKCLINLRQIGKAMQMYFDDWGGVMMPVVGYHPYYEHCSWTWRLSPYNDDLSLFQCPSDNHWFSYGMNWQVHQREVDSVKAPRKFILVFEVPGSGLITPSGDPATAMADSDLTNEAQTDGEVYGCFTERRDDIPISRYGETNPMQSASPCGRALWQYLYFPGRHMGGNNILFLDGHVRWFYDWDDDLMTFDPNEEMPARRR